MKRALLLFLIVAGSPAVALAQRGGGIPRGAAPSIKREPGLTIPKPVNMLNLLIEHRQDVALSDSQFKQVITFKRELDSTNAPQMRRLDSLSRLFRGGKPMFAETSPLRRDSLSRANNVMQQVVAIVGDNNAAARDQVYALLSETQLTKVKTIEAAAEKARADAERPPGKP
ncbi:MAG TPA: hypothetical protein VGM82_10350 [Gemmatimonadaceae bacterium]